MKRSDRNPEEQSFYMFLEFLFSAKKGLTGLVSCL